MLTMCMSVIVLKWLQHYVIITSYPYQFFQADLDATPVFSLLILICVTETGKSYFKRHNIEKLLMTPILESNECKNQ